MLRSGSILTLVLTACTPLGSFEVGRPPPDEDESDTPDIEIAPSLPDEAQLAWDTVTDDRADAQWTEAGELPQLRAFDGAPLPLRHTDVHADVRGHIADVVVRQTYVNDRSMPIDVTYAFPLPENAAVWDMRLVVGDRVITSDVRKRDEARKAYEAAREAGHTAALLEQERPNLFTQSVANIGARAKIEVELRYVQTLSFDGGTFELVFPTAIGPRYTDRHVPDVARITPLVVPQRMHAGDDFTIVVDIAGAGEDVKASTHAIIVDQDDTRVHVELTEGNELPNRDFVLRWRSTASKPGTTLFVGPRDENGEGYFELVMVPPRLDVDRIVGRRELVFVLDVSGSMHGVPLALEKELLRAALRDLRPVDTFDVVTFAGGATRLFDKPQPANAARIAEALAFVDRLDAGGGTEMLSGVELALGGVAAPGRVRYVVFMTDGFIGDEERVFDSARELVERMAAAHRVARVFAVGVGAGPNRYLTTGLAKAGAGISLSLGTREDPLEALAKIERVISAPVLTDVDIAFDCKCVDELFPSEAPDLFATHPTIVHGRWRGTPPDAVLVRAQEHGRAVSLPVRVVKSREDDTLLGRLWARAQIDELETRIWASRDGDAVKAITALGLEHRLVTRYTSLVAIDSSRKVDGESMTIEQPTYATEGVDIDMAGGRSYTAGGLSLGGATATEAKYTVEGANIKSPSFGTRSNAIVQEYLDEASIDGVVGGPHRQRTSLALTRIDGGSLAGRRAIRRSMFARRYALRRCLAGIDAGRGLFVDLQVVVGDEVHAELGEGTGLSTGEASCLERVVTEASWKYIAVGSYRIVFRLVTE